MRPSFNSLHFLFFALACLLVSCDHREDESVFSKTENPANWCVEGVTELRRGDILVKPNLNIFPGTSFLGGGTSFGHAALVVRGYSHPDPDSLLAHAITVESIAKDVPQEYQVREIAALTHHKFDAFNNTNFDKTNTGRRYRLRLNLTEQQIDSIVEFALRQKGDFSSWNAMKSLPDAHGKNTNDWADNNCWYCSLLVWQSVLKVTGLNLDPNGGYTVFPNDLINSPLFNNDGTHIGRARF